MAVSVKKEQAGKQTDRQAGRQHLAVADVGVGLEARFQHIREQVLPRSVAALEQLLAGKGSPDVPDINILAVVVREEGGGTVI